MAAAEIIPWRLRLPCYSCGASPGTPRPFLAAHRGGAGVWPENSLLAFRNAIALGVEFLELDVHLAGNGEVVVIHDSTLERTTTGAGAVRDRTLAELRALSLKDKNGKVTDQAIPALDELLALAAPANLNLLLEIKRPKRGRYAGIEEKVLSLLDSRRMVERTCVVSFDTAHLERARHLNPAIRLGGLLSERQAGSGRSVSALMDEVEGVKGQFVGLQHTLLDASVVAAAHRRGFFVGAWTVNDEPSMRRALEIGVDVLITDRPDLAGPLLR